MILINYAELASELDDRLTMTINSHIKNELTRIATTRYNTRSGLVRQILAEWVQEHSKEDTK